MKTQIYLVALLVSLVGCATVKAQSRKEKLNTYLEHLFKSRKMMGNVSISHNDSIVYSKSIGFANVDLKIKNNENTKFRVGSITKTFTSVLILKVIEEGRLSLDDKLSDYYPQIINSEKITIEQLLKHRTGIFNYTEIPGNDVWEQKFHTEKEIINYFADKKSNFEPGTKFEYCNTNYILLGFILQRIFNKPYAEILEEKICRPLHLKNTYFTAETDETKNEALSYNIQNEYRRNSKVNFSNYFSTGGIATTAKELNEFLSALFNGKIITNKSLEMMLPKNNEEYGMGIEKFYGKNPEGYIHGGRVENYFSSYWYFPKEKLGIVCLSNAINIEPTDVQMTLLQSVFGKNPKLPNFNQTNKISEKEFKKIAGTYIARDKSNTITISSDSKNLILQNSLPGQMFVPFVYKGINRFEYMNDILLKFFPSKKEMTVEQNNHVEYYKKL